MARGVQNRFTVYDAMEARGAFASNPANASSADNDGNSLYRGPVQYPMMFYHPMGEMKIIVPGEVITTPLGAKVVGEQKELVWQIARDEQEEKDLLAAGWHRSPGLAIVAGGGKAPPMGLHEQMQQMDQEKAAMLKELEELRAEKAKRAALANSSLVLGDKK